MPVLRPSTSARELRRHTSAALVVRTDEMEVVDYAVDMAEIPTLQERRLDPDGDGAPSAEEAAYRSAACEDLPDGAPAPGRRRRRP